MVYKSYSSSYSFISDGKNTKEEKHEMLNNNNQDIKKLGTQNYNNLMNKTMKQNFYKTHNNKSLYGTTGVVNMKDQKKFRIQEQINNKKHKEYLSNKKYDMLFKSNKNKTIEHKKDNKKSVAVIKNPFSSFKKLLNVFDEPFFNQ